MINWKRMFAANFAGALMLVASAAGALAGDFYEKEGDKAAIDPAAFTVVNDKLYLNYNRSVQKQWSADIPGFVAKAEKNWPQVTKQTKVIE